MEHKYLPILTKEINDERTVKSIFAVMGNVDDGYDRIWPGAFGKTISERLPRIKALWQHDAGQPPIGVVTGLKEIGRDELPEAVTAQFPAAIGALLGEVKYLDTQRGNEVLEGIKSGAITENSIGYDPVKFDFEEIPGKDIGMLRNLREIRLWDVSPVNWGMNPATTNLKGIIGQDPRLSALHSAASLLLSPGALKAGRVLSANNMEKLKAALTAIQEILEAAEPPADEEAAKALTARLTLELAIREREFSLMEA